MKTTIVFLIGLLVLMTIAFMSFDNSSKIIKIQK